MDQEELLKKGRAAKAVLSNTTIMSAFEELQEDLKTQMVSTSPDQSKERNILYYQHLGVVNLLAYLSTYAAAAEQIEE
jgi:hypothetical protein